MTFRTFTGESRIVHVLLPSKHMNERLFTACAGVGPVAADETLHAPTCLLCIRFLEVGTWNV